MFVYIHGKLSVPGVQSLIEAASYQRC